MLHPCLRRGPVEKYETSAGVSASRYRSACEWPAGAWPEPQTNPQKIELGHQLAAHDALGVLADVQDGPFDISVPARPAWTRSMIL